MTPFDLDAVPGVLNRPEWLDEVEATLGRPLRVLNLGNIANNGFQNAKIMRRAGIDADCVAYDYYHVMGTAEWEDADYRGNIGDQFYPDWWRVRFKNYARPDWFIQGPKSYCLEYIHSRFDSDAAEGAAVEKWQRLQLEGHYHSYLRSSLTAAPKSPLSWPGWIWRKLSFRKFLAKTYLTQPAIFKYRFRKQIAGVSNGFRALITIITLPFFLLALGLSLVLDKLIVLVRLFPSKSRGALLELRRIKRRMLVQSLRQKIYPFAFAIAGTGAKLFRKITGKRFGAVFGDRTADRITQFMGVRSKSEDRITVNMDIEEIQRRRAARRAKRLAAQEADNRDIATLDMEETIEEVREAQEEGRDTAAAYYQAYLYYLELAHPDQGWIVQHYEHFHDQSPEDLREDVTIAKILAKDWEGVFEYYDVILAYSTDGILSMAGSEMPFFTYEHGTLRSIPFEPTTMGRLCATSYRACEALMVTNLDNVDKPPRLGMDPEQVVYLPHAVDDKKLLGFRHAHKDIVPSNHDRPMFLCPARQDWGDDDPSLMKGNDKLLKATKIIFDEGYRPRVVLFEWGRHVEKSKALIEELGIGEVISWVKPMKKTELWKSYFRCHAIVDQFSIPAFGGVTFEGLTFSKRIITSIDQQQSKDFFGEYPPVLNCSEPEGIAEAMRAVLNDPEDKNGLGRAGGLWAKQYHSSQRILDLQLRVFEPAVRASMHFKSDGTFAERRPAVRKSRT